MICRDCREAADTDRPAMHMLCKGDTHCDCQHKPKGSGIQAESLIATGEMNTNE